MSVAFDVMPRPDWAATTTVSVPEGAEQDVETWARAVFDVRSVPVWVKALFVVRAGVVKLMGVPPGTPSMLAVDRIERGEAVIDTDDRHLRFVATTWLTPGLLHVTTAVTLKGLRGRLYYLPVRLLHDPVTRSMMEAAVRRLAPRA